MIQITNDTPIAMLTVGQLKEVLFGTASESPKPQTEKAKNYVYGITGIAKIFNCSRATANRIKASGKIDKAIKQIGRKILVDADLALQLVDSKNN